MKAHIIHNFTGSLPWDVFQQATPTTPRIGAERTVTQSVQGDEFLQEIAECAIINSMNRRQQETLEKIFQTPVSVSLEWRDIETLFLALEAKPVEGRGSRVRFELNGVVATFHRPHPEKEAKPYQVRDARRFLEQAGIKP